MSKERYLLIPASEPPRIVAIDRKRWVDEMDAALTCDCFEVVHIGNNRLLLVDESGVNNGKPYNVIASLFYPAGIFGDAILAIEKIGTDGEMDIYPYSELITGSLLKGAQELYNQI